jgi:hypothetical protein
MKKTCTENIPFHYALYILKYLILQILALSLQDNSGSSVVLQCIYSEKWSEVKEMVENGTKLDVKFKDIRGVLLY